MLKCVKGEDRINADKSKVMVMYGGEGLKCEVHVDEIPLEHVSEFKYLVCVLDECTRTRYR